MKTQALVLSMLLYVMLSFFCCAEPEPKKVIDVEAVSSVDRRIGALPVNTSYPINNVGTPAQVKLGKLLFFDPILSGNKDVSCATCHHPTMGYAENLEKSIGVNGTGLGSKRVFNTPNDIPLVKRNAQTILNTAYNGIKLSGKFNAENAPMFWDLRATGLEAQALEPIKALEEMRGTHFEEKDILDIIVGRLSAIEAYRALFYEAFQANEITEQHIAKAIASFERTLTTQNSRFDLYMRGDDNAISQSEKEGLFLFKKAGCDNCHNGPMFSDYKIHVIGAPELSGDTFLDKGFNDEFGFRTPTLRNLNVTAPYMHNGSLTSLLRVLEFYEDISGAKLRNPHIGKDKMDHLIDEINLTIKDMRPIISFLNCLNDNSYDQEIPESVPSGLKVGGN